MDELGFMVLIGCLATGGEASVGGIPFTQSIDPFGKFVSEAGKGSADFALGRCRLTRMIDNQGERLYNECNYNPIQIV